MIAVAMIEDAQEALSAYVATRDSAALNYGTDVAREAFRRTRSLPANSEIRLGAVEVLGICLLYDHLVVPNRQTLDEAVALLRSVAADHVTSDGVTFATGLYILGLAIQHQLDPESISAEQLLTNAWNRLDLDNLIDGIRVTPAGLSDAAIHLLELQEEAPARPGPNQTRVRQALVLVYRHRAELTGHRSDLDLAIAWSDKIQGDPGRDLQYAHSQLDRAACLALRYEASGDLTDLNLAIESCERGIESTIQAGFDPTQSRLGYQWFELGLCRRMRAERTKRDEDFEESLLAYRMGFDLVGRDDSHGNNGFLALLQTDWGQDRLSDEQNTSLLLSDEWLNDQSEGGAILRWNVARKDFFVYLEAQEFSDARSWARELEDRAEGMANLPTRRLDALTDVAGMWHRLFEDSGDNTDRLRSIEIYERTLEQVHLRSPHEQAILWRAVGYLRAKGEEIELARVAYESGLTAMHLAVRESTGRADQEHLLEALSGLVSDVVVAACLSDDAGRGSEVAWYSMGTLYREATRRRAAVHALSEEVPNAGDELRHLYRESGEQWTQLDTGVVAVGENRVVNVRREHASRVRELTARVETSLEVGDDASDDQATDLDDLAGAIKVVVCVSHMGVEAFVYTGEQLWCSYGRDARSHINGALNAYASVLDGDVVGDEAEQLLDEVLMAVGANIFQPLVEWIRDHTSEVRPLVQFCLSGRLGTLPLGAMWIPSSADEQTKVRLADVISYSVLPALSAYVPERPPVTPESLSPALIVAAWHVAGRKVLGETKKEAQDIVGLAATTDVRVLGLDASTPATYEAVVGGLDSARLFHYTGHADIDYEHPDLSCLVLDDVAQMRLTAGAVAELDLSGGTLAFLSACAVGHTRGRLRDDPFDLGSAFLYAGYEFVVAPLRPIPDDLAREAAVRFYQALFADGIENDGERNVHGAFDDMVRSLRESYPNDVMAWAGFVLLESPASIAQT